MGEARRRRQRADTAILQLQIVDPIAAMMSDRIDGVILSALAETVSRFQRHPPPICAACSHEFVRGEEPALVSILRLAFAAEGERVPLIISGICPTCASLPGSELEARVAERLRSISPGMTRVATGRA